MTDTAESLDPLRLPLQGERLIEASAGTGKTFTIAALYLRLLLGLGGNTAFPRPLSVEELLVVTFTEAATQDLRERLRRRLVLTARVAAGTWCTRKICAPSVTPRAMHAMVPPDAPTSSACACSVAQAQGNCESRYSSSAVAKIANS